MHPMTLPGVAAAAALAVLAPCALAQSQGANVVKLGITEYTTHESTNGVTGVGVPAGADVSVGNATTVIFCFERLFTPNVGLELVIGVPPKLKASGAGSVAFLGEVLSVRTVAPTLLLNYHFLSPSDALRPYVGAGVNYTRFTSISSTLAPDVKMGDSTGLALQAGLNYAITKDIALFASVAKLNVKSKVVASGATVLQTTVDFRPIVYSAGIAYQF